MKLNHYIYSLIAGLVLMLSACSPDEYDMGKKTYVPMTWRKVLPTL